MLVYRTMLTVKCGSTTDNTFREQGQDCGHEHQFIVAIVTSIKPVNRSHFIPFPDCHASICKCTHGSSYFKILILTLEITECSNKGKIDIFFHTLFVYLKCKWPETKQMLILMEYFNLDNLLPNCRIFFSNIRK